jgi:hypothetical protein
MEKPSYSMFASTMLNTVRKLIQILTSWFVITLKRNTQVVVLVLKHLMLPSRDSDLDMFECSMLR